MLKVLLTNARKSPNVGLQFLKIRVKKRLSFFILRLELRKHPHH
jgi:hypothetical protein